MAARKPAAGENQQQPAASTPVPPAPSTPASPASPPAAAPPAEATVPAPPLEAAPAAPAEPAPAPTPPVVSETTVEAVEAVEAAQRQEQIEYEVIAPVAVLPLRAGGERYVYRGTPVGEAFTPEGIEHALSVKLIRRIQQ